MNNLTRTILTIATIFSVLGAAARERSSLFGSRSSGSGQSPAHESGFTSRGTSQSSVSRPSFGQSAPANRSTFSAPAPRVQSATPRVSAPQPTITRTPSAPAATRQSYPQPVCATPPRPSVTWQRPAESPTAQTRPPTTVTRTLGTSRATPTVTRRATPSVTTPRAPVAQPPTTVTRTPGTSRATPTVTRPATPSVTTPRTPVARPPTAVAHTGSAAPTRTRPEISFDRTPSAGSGRETSTRTATLDRPAGSRSATAHIDRDAISRLPSAAERAAATRLARPDERSQIQAATRGTDALRHGGTSSTLRQPAGNRLAYAPSSLRSNASRLTTRDTSLPGRRSISSTRTKPAAADPATMTSRYRDGRYSVYTPPARHTARHVNPYRPGYHRPERRDHNRRAHRRDHHSSFYLGLAIGSGWYTPGWHGPAWYGPAYYPASGFSFSWSNRRYGLSIWNSAPVYATPYYDSWSGGGWGFSSLYYGGWHSGWYGGVSYIYNPWPVYRTTYFYDPVPVVTRTETVYVTQPALQTTVVYEEPKTYASAPAAPLNACLPAAPASVTAPVLPQPVPDEQPPARSEWAWDDVPAVEQVDAEVSGYYCPGQNSFLSDYPYGAEYAVTRNAFDLSMAFVSYADSLDPETIWFSYAGLDRWDVLDSHTLYADSAATLY